MEGEVEFIKILKSQLELLKDNKKNIQKVRKKISELESKFKFIAMDEDEKVSRVEIKIGKTDDEIEEIKEKVKVLKEKRTGKVKEVDLYDKELEQRFMDISREDKIIERKQWELQNTELSLESMHKTIKNEEIKLNKNNHIKNDKMKEIEEVES